MTTVLGYVPLTGTQWGTAQNETFGILIGVFIMVVLLTLFWSRTGHETAHRRNVMRQVARAALERGRPQELEDQEPPPRAGESLPR